MVTVAQAREAENWLVSFTSPLTEQGVKKVLEASNTIRLYIEQHANTAGEELELLRAKARCWDALHDEDDCDQVAGETFCSLCERSQEALIVLQALQNPETPEPLPPESLA